MAAAAYSPIRYLDSGGGQGQRRHLMESLDFYNETSNTTMYPDVNLSSSTALPDVQCHELNYENYQIATSVICGMCFVFGIVYTFFGYRFFKAVMFLTGFLFGTLLVYLVCMDIDPNFLPLGGIIGVSLGVGLMCGIITMLVQYIGLFMTGLHLGIGIATIALIITEQIIHIPSKWICLGTIFGLGIILGLMNLKFQKGCTILGTSVLGCALMVGCLDYFIEQFLMVDYVFSILRALDRNLVDTVCWFSWIVLGCWPFTAIIGIFIQWRVTGYRIDHAQVIRNKKMQKVNLQRLRACQGAEVQHSRYRHLYQVRRVKGDVISQDYMKGMRVPRTNKPVIQGMTKLSSEQGMTNLSSDQILPGRESTTTTLTQVP